MNKNLIRLTESDIRNIVKKSVNRVLREYGSDGPDFDDYEVPGYEGTNVPDGLEYDELYPEEDFDEFLGDAHYMREPNIGNRIPSASDIDSDEDLLNMESRRRMGKIIRESINKVLSRRSINEGSIGLETVPEDVARRYGFKPEYNMGNGTEIWGRYLNQHELESSNRLLFKLGIKSWASHSITGHVRIYVKHENTKSKPKEPGEWGRPQRRRKIGDYVDTEWMDNGGAIFHNPKNGHVKRFNVQDF